MGARHGSSRRGLLRQAQWGAAAPGQLAGMRALAQEAQRASGGRCRLGIGGPSGQPCPSQPGGSPMVTRRQFLGFGAAAPFLERYHQLAAAEKKRFKIRDVQTLMLQGPRTYTLGKGGSDDGEFGIAEAYGSPGVGERDQVNSLRAWLVGKDPLEIDKLYSLMGEHTKDLSGTRTDGSAHGLMRAVSGIEMALWALAGKLLGAPATTLLGGRFRDKVPVLGH